MKYVTYKIVQRKTNVQINKQMINHLWFNSPTHDPLKLIQRINTNPKTMMIKLGNTFLAYIAML